MNDYTQTTLAFLDGLRRQGHYPFCEFLHFLRSSAKVCVFGAGEWAANVCGKLSRPEIGIAIHCCCDNDTSKWGQTFFGVPCISLPELLALKDEVTVLIVTGYCHEIYQQLKQAGVRNLYVLNKEYVVLGAENLMRRVQDDAEFAQFREQVAELMDLLVDEQSLRTASTIIRNWFTFSPFEQDYAEINVPDQYFPADIICLSDREVFVDLGAYDGKNTLEFIERSGKRFDAAYAFEMDRNNFALLANAFRARPDNGAYSVREVLSPSAMPAALDEATLSGNAGGTVFLCRFGVGSTQGSIWYRSQSQASAADALGDCLAEIARIDDVLVGQPVTLLKIDIEGAEMEALEGAKETIRRWKPQVAACVYHNPDHLLQLPLFLKTLVPEYALFLRHHSQAEVETVCYAIC